MLDWLSDQETFLWWIGILSLVTFAGSLILVPVLIVRIPADYFVGDRQRPGRWERQHPVVRMVGRVLKNLLGLLLVPAGVAMLALPGQGLVTILLGLMLIDVPGKRVLVRRILQRPNVLRVINALRARAGRPPLQVDDQAERDSG